MRKAAHHLIKIGLFFCFAACSNNDEAEKKLRLAERMADSAAEATIDSAYKAIRLECDTMLQVKAIYLADSVGKIATRGPKTKANDTTIQYMIHQLVNKNREKSAGENAVYASEKATKIIRQLRADCDTSLQKETYRLVQLKLQTKQPAQPAKKNRPV